MPKRKLSDILSKRALSTFNKRASIYLNLHHNANPCYFDFIPSDIIILIFSTTSIPDLHNLRLCCKNLDKLILHNRMYHRVLQEMLKDTPFSVEFTLLHADKTLNWRFKHPILIYILKEIELPVQRKKPTQYKDKYLST